MELIAGLSQLADLASSPDSQGSVLVSGSATALRLVRRLSQDERAALAEAYRDGATVLDLVASFEVSRNTILQVLDDEGVRRRHRKLGPDGLEEARRLYESGWSFARVGAELGVDPKTVHTAFAVAT